MTFVWYVTRVFHSVINNLFFHSLYFGFQFRPHFEHSFFALNYWQSRYSNLGRKRGWKTIQINWISTENKEIFNLSTITTQSFSLLRQLQKPPRVISPDASRIELTWWIVENCLLVSCEAGSSFLLSLWPPSSSAAAIFLPCSSATADWPAPRARPRPRRSSERPRQGPFSSTHPPFPLRYRSGHGLIEIREVFISYGVI